MTVGEAATKLGVDPHISDEEVVKRVLAGETALYEIIMRRHNQRLYRAVRAILGNDGEVEQVMQDAYVAAYTHLEQFAQRSKFSTWLTKIAIYEALARKRKQSRFVELDSIEEKDKGYSIMLVSKERDPEQQAIAEELRDVLESSIEELPQRYRSVFVLREIEGMDTAETAESLGISQETVKTRLHRARGLVREELYARTGSSLGEAFHFHLSRCDRVVAGVFQRIQANGGKPGTLQSGDRFPG
jgi:RNA polymerase sigma-70 factor, ECF subfamily